MRIDESVELRKDGLLAKFRKRIPFSPEDEAFMEERDWHPVDELPLKESFIRELKEAEKGPFIRLNSVDELFESG